MASASQLLDGLKAGDAKLLARALTVVENELDGWQQLLLGLEPDENCRIIGFTGPPGAGKSTLVNSLLNYYQAQSKKIAVLAIDPTSPFNFGSLLGDRVRMNKHFTDKNVFIRSLATRGSLGGLSAKTIEMCDVLRAAQFDFIFIETVGVGQSEVEIAGLADDTVVVLVPESGDEVQFIKSGLMEIADVFVVNKADREGAESFANNLKKMLHQRPIETPVFKTNAELGEGVAELADRLSIPEAQANPRKLLLLADKAYKLICEKRMKFVNKKELQAEIALAAKNADFNLYRFVEGKI